MKNQTVIIQSNGNWVEKHHHRNCPLKTRYWVKDDKYHRLDGPAIINYYENGQIEKEEYYINGLLYRENGPSIVRYYRNGDKAEEHWSYENGIKKQTSLYYRNGNLKCQFYFNNKNELSKLDGPAIIRYSENGSIESEEYFVNGIKYDEELQYLVAVGAN